MRTRHVITLILGLLSLSLAGAAPAAADASAPVNTTRPSITGVPNVSVTLRVNPGSWSGDQPITFTQQWLRCDAAGHNCADIANATGQAYAPVLTDAGATIAVRVHATNAAGSGDAVSDPTAVVLQAPTFIVVGVAQIDKTSATVAVLANGNGKTTSCRVDYGTTTDYGTSADCGTFVNAVQRQVLLSPLQAGSVYHFQVVLSNADGTTASGDRVLKTNAAEAPFVTTRAATSIGPASAVANALVSPNGSAVASCVVEYGLDTRYGATAPCDRIPDDASGTVPVAATLSGLTASTTYHYHFLVQNLVGPPTDGGDFTFTTLPPATPVNTTPPAITGDASFGSTLSVDHGRWSGGGTQTFAFQWLRCDAAGQGCAEIANATGSTYKPLQVDAGRTLAVRVTVTNEAGSGSVVTAPTAVVLAPPSISLAGASSIGATSATVVALIVSNGRTTTCQVDYGTTTAYGKSVPCGGPITGGAIVQVPLRGLLSTTFYHFRIVATNADGRTSSGDRTFMTTS
jgi:hypothetical protein